MEEARMGGAGETPGPKSSRYLSTPRSSPIFLILFPFSTIEQRAAGASPFSRSDGQQAKLPLRPFRSRPVALDEVGSPPRCSCSQVSRHRAHSSGVLHLCRWIGALCHRVSWCRSSAISARPRMDHRLWIFVTTWLHVTVAVSSQARASGKRNAKRSPDHFTCAVLRCSEGTASRIFSFQIPGEAEREHFSFFFLLLSKRAVPTFTGER